MRGLKGGRLCVGMCLLPSPAMLGVLLAIGYTALLLFCMRRSPFFARVPGLLLRNVALLFLLKILAGTALWAVYTWVYPDRSAADIFKYFDDSAVMFAAIYEKPMDYFKMLFSIANDNPYFDTNYYKVMNNWYREYESNMHNDAHTIIRFNAALRLFSFGEFHVHTVFAAFLSLTGAVALYRGFVEFLPGRERLLAIAVFLIPSVVFWGSGVIKESLLFFGLGILIWQWFKLLGNEISVWGLLLICGACVLLFHLKFYVIASLVPGLAMLLLERTARRVPFALRTALVLLGAVSLALNLHYLLPSFNVLEILAVKQRDFIGLAQATDAGSFVMPERLTPTLSSFIAQAPHALFSALFGPLFHPGAGLFGLVAAVENLVILAAMILMVFYRLPNRLLDRALLSALLTYIVVLALVIGWTTPVMGALVRYRVPLLPFLLIVGALILDHRKLLARWPALKSFISA